MNQNKTTKYFKYAIGEIILVVIGILIALQINNWNEGRIQQTELTGLLQNINNGLQSDVRSLNLLVTARKNIGEKTDLILETIENASNYVIDPGKATYINTTFSELNNLIYFRSNSNAFETLSSSTIFRNIQNTDLATLLSAYYNNAEKIQEIEERHNEELEYLKKEWFSKFKDIATDLEIFIRPWKFFNNFSDVESRYLEILKSPQTTEILKTASYERSFIKQYEEQLLMGKTIIKMIRNSETTFDEQTKLAFSGFLYAFSDADIISILINGKLPTGFAIKNVASGILEPYITTEDDHLVIEYPENKYLWASPYFEVNALEGRVNEMDFLGYTKLFIEMKGDVGGETFEIAMKDKNDPPDGSESRVTIKLTNEWKTYEVEISNFKTADMKVIMVPLAFIFQGNKGRKIQLRTIQFKKI
jgi:hypothetical protein